jgi:hypothetical protein
MEPKVGIEPTTYALPRCGCEFGAFCIRKLRDCLLRSMSLRFLQLNDNSLQLRDAQLYRKKQREGATERQVAPSIGRPSSNVAHPSFVASARWIVTPAAPTDSPLRPSWLTTDWSVCKKKGLQRVTIEQHN